MGTIRQPVPVKLVVATLAAAAGYYPSVEQALEQHFGPIDYRSQDLPFEYTDYYTPEMGPHLIRRFYGFARLVDPGELASIKVLTNTLEQEWSQEGRRRVNLDPGYIGGAKFVLATTKDYSHRIYLGQGIYAEVTLLYRRGAFEPLPWTYPDYRTETYRRILGEMRALYLAALREHPPQKEATRQSS